MYADAIELAYLAANATYGGPITRELPAALVAADRGDRRPLLRLVAEANGSTPEEGLEIYSAGQYAAVICNDYPTVFDRSAPTQARRRQYGRAVEDLQRDEPEVFAPFSLDTWLALDWGESASCLAWPPSTHRIEPVAEGTPAPDVPTLVLAGDLDTVTSFSGAREVADRFANSTFVTVANGFHAPGLGDRGHCTSTIISRFIESEGDAGDTACAGEYPEVRLVESFWEHWDDVPGSAESEAIDFERVAALASATAGDAIGRWWSNYDGSAAGLRGGSVEIEGWDIVEFRLRDAAFVADVTATGDFEWDRSTGVVRGEFELAGALTANVHFSWNALEPNAKLHATVAIDGTRVAVRVRAP